MRQIVKKLTEMNEQGNLSSDNLRPVVEYRVTDHYSAPMMAVASHLREMGMNAEARSIYGKMGAIKAGSNRLLQNLGVENVKLATEIERNMVGKGRSGYQPTGNLMKSIKAHTTEDGRVQVYPDAKANKGNGAEYGGFVEYGTRRHPTPEPFMYQSMKQMRPIVAAQVAALMKGMSFNG